MFQVFAIDKISENLESLKSECPNIHTICLDLSNWQATREAVQKITPIQLLVNNAGIALLAPALEATEEEVDFLFNINLKPVMNITQVVCNDLVKRDLKGSVVNLSSITGHRAFKDFIIYGPAKAALDMMTKVILIIVNSVL